MRGWALLIAGILPALVAAQTPPAFGPTSTRSASTDAGGLQIQESLDLLVGENTHQARRVGAAKLLEIGTQNAFDRLADILSGSPDTSAPIAICEALGSTEHPPVPMLKHLVTRLGDSSPGLNEAVIRAIRSYPSAMVVQSVGPLAQDPHAPLARRLAAIACLAEAGDDFRTIKLLAALLERSSPSIQAAALNTLRRASGLDHASVEAARDWWKLNSSLTADEWLRKSSSFRRFNNRQADLEKSSLIRRFVTASRDAYLATPETHRPEKLLSLLRDELPALRSLGLDLINDLITDRKDISPESKLQVVEMIGDADPPVRLVAARIASELRLHGASQRLGSAFEQESIPDVRGGLAAALGRMDDPGAMQILIAGLHDDSPNVIGECILAIGSLARKRLDAPTLPKGLSTQIIEEFKQLSPAQTDLRFKYVQAMARIAAAEFLPLLIEQTRNGDVQVRIAAIAGLSAYGSEDVLRHMRSLIDADEPRMRLAVAEALGKCGRGSDDLAALAKHLHAEQEVDALVREQSWNSYVNICANFPAEELLDLAESFDRPGDRPSQQHRLDLLRILRGDDERFEQLGTQQRVLVLSRMATIQDGLGDFAAAAGCYESAADLLGDKHKEAKDLLVQCVRSRLRAGQDSKVLEQLSAISGNLVNGNAALLTNLGSVFLEEISARIQVADDHASINQLHDLTARATPFLEGHGFSAELKALGEQTVRRRAELVDHLISRISADPEASVELSAFSAADVIPRIINKLRNESQTLGNDEITKLISVAKKMVPSWKGLDPNADAALREKALADLLGSISSPRAAPVGG